MNETMLHLNLRKVNLIMFSGIGENERIELIFDTKYSGSSFSFMDGIV